MRRDPARAILVLDAMLEFFDGGRRWTQGELLDESGQSRCLIGALHYVRQQQRVRGGGTEFYLYASLPKAFYGASKAAPIDVLIEFAKPRRRVPDHWIMNYNDNAISYDHVRALIIAARAIAQAEIDAAPDRRRTSRLLQPDRAVKEALL